ncbi:FHA domain-containing serine/threonine-protein kinase [Streptomyces sp. NPDC000410]|uniref:FHA domain-containing serine/threonine-protein kinase n=1 Tax=Streptomyces sp. NPDC000410 TaxID=3154254 RepID=UPI003316B39E
MTALVTVSVHSGAAIEEYVYRERVTCEVGRSAECAIRIAERHRGVSRRHCRLDIDPPLLRVRDLGSSYGTHVNGERLGRLTEHPLAHGDEVRVGDVTLRIAVAEGPDDAAGTTREEPADPAPAVVGDYAIVRELGRGSQGVVHLARHTGTGELVALKRVRATRTVDEHARFAFRREFESIRALRHPNIVEFRGSGDRRGEFYFVCEYCPGGGLERLAALHGGTVPVADALHVVRQVLSGLAHAHRAVVPAPTHADGTGGTHTTARGLVHRDVKPANILLARADAGARPVVKLADFGLAKAFEHAGLSGHTRTGALGGTIPFTARTQLLGYKYAGPEVDVWAAAACLYWLLTGATPRDFPPHKDPVAVALREPVVRIRERDPSIPHRLADVIDEALVDTPRITIGTATELAGALEAAAP